MDPKYLKKHLLLSPDEARKLKRCIMFLRYVHISRWFKCTSLTLAPYLDLQVIKTLFSFVQVDPVAADSAVNKLNLHLWYLFEEMIHLLLFDDDVSLDKRVGIAALCFNAMSQSYQTQSKEKKWQTKFS